MEQIDNYKVFLYKFIEPSIYNDENFQNHQKLCNIKDFSFSQKREWMLLTF